MEVSATLADFIGSLELAAQIPAYLSKKLDLESLTLAVVRDDGLTKAPSLFLRGSSGMVAIGESAATFSEQVLAIYQQTRPLTPADTPTLRHSFDEMEAPSEMTVQHLVLFPRATVFARGIKAGEERHRVLLIVHQRAEDPHLSAGLANILQRITDQLAKLMMPLVIWHTRPEDLGEPFSRLTAREWMVLRGLMTEAGEKQLADQLTLSPHTLHSHIKSIYRKLGVQGRLPLLKKIADALRDLKSRGQLGRVESAFADSAEPAAVAS
jgi:DNA-binding CsgD family transcriptional regulator